MVVIERPLRGKVTSLERLARLASVNHETLSIPPEVAGELADYLREALATSDDQAWFWSQKWQAGELEAETDLESGRCQVFDSMEDLIDDLGWPR